MKKTIYYIVLVASLIACMLGVSLVMALVEEWCNIKLGQMLMNFGFLVGIGLFFSIKPLIKKWLIDKHDRNKLK
jgi:hypothetical protein